MMGIKIYYHILLFVFLDFLISSIGYGQESSAYQLIVEDDFYGVILPLSTKIPYLNKERYLPSYNEIVNVEKWLIENPEQLLSKKHHQKQYCPDVFKHIDKYLRQYVAYIDDSKPILLINGFWSEDIDVFPDWKTDYVMALDGCTYFWRARFDIQQKKMISIEFNSEN